MNTVNEVLTPLPNPLILVVAGALFDASGRVLMQRRPIGKQHGGLWEFPGGKVEAGEAPSQALARELAEELAIALDPAACAPLAFATTDRIVLLLYRCTSWTGVPTAGDGAALDWIATDALGTLPMPTADVALVASISWQALRAPSRS